MQAWIKRILTKYPKTSNLLIVLLTWLRCYDDMYVDRDNMEHETFAAIPNGKRVIYVDISRLVDKDANEGVQRVEKIILELMIRNYSDRFLIIPIYFRHGYCYCAYSYANKLRHKKLLKFITDDACITELLPQSIFLRPEINFFMSKSKKISKWLITQKMQNNVLLINIIHDLIPLRYKELCVASYAANFRDEIVATSLFFDATICVSKTVAEDYLLWLKEEDIAREIPMKVAYFHLGADIEQYNSHCGNTEIMTDLSKVEQHEYFLMVATIEPKKGYTLVLDAFDKLWDNGCKKTLVIVGKSDWRSPDLVKRLTSHPMLNKTLFWFGNGISDLDLIHLYKNASAFIMASVVEGFGLGIVEAAKYKKPLILRDIPVFHEIAGANAFYFSATDGDALADEIAKWIKLAEMNMEPNSHDLEPITWEESCDWLMDIMINGRWICE